MRHKYNLISAREDIMTLWHSLCRFPWNLVIRYLSENFLCQDLGPKWKIWLSLHNFLRNSYILNGIAFIFSMFKFNTPPSPPRKSARNVEVTVWNSFTSWSDVRLSLCQISRRSQLLGENKKKILYWVLWKPMERSSPWYQNTDLYSSTDIIRVIE
jgi:hypothetical protein